MYDHSLFRPQNGAVSSDEFVNILTQMVTEGDNWESQVSPRTFREQTTQTVNKDGVDAMIRIWQSLGATEIQD